MSLELGCRTLKARYQYATPAGKAALTIIDPVSLDIGEPDAALFQKHQDKLNGPVLATVQTAQEFEDRVIREGKKLAPLTLKKP